MIIFEYSLADQNFERKSWRTIEESKESLMSHHVESLEELQIDKKEGRKEKKLEKNKMNPCID